MTQIDDLQELYQQLIIDHSRSPRNFRSLCHSQRRAEGYNPLCGDRISLCVNFDGDKVGECCFCGTACAICTASASMMTDAVRGHTEAEAREKFEQFHEMLTGSGDAEAPAEALGKLAVFAGVKRFPIRVKCATLPWHTLIAALDQEDQVVSTE